MIAQKLSLIDDSLLNSVQVCWVHCWPVRTVTTELTDKWFIKECRKRWFDDGCLRNQGQSRKSNILLWGEGQAWVESQIDRCRDSKQRHQLGTGRVQLGGRLDHTQNNRETSWSTYVGTGKKQSTMASLGQNEEAEVLAEDRQSSGKQAGWRSVEVNSKLLNTILNWDRLDLSKTVLCHLFSL